MAAAGTGFIPGYSKGRTAAERLEVVKLLIDLGQDVVNSAFKPTLDETALEQLARELEASGNAAPTRSNSPSMSAPSRSGRPAT